MLAIINDKLSAPETENLIEAYLSENKVPKENPKNAPKKRKKPLVKGIIKDLKFFFNTLDKSVGILENSGYKAVWNKTERDDGVEITIRIGR
jgi:hypothetical protein